jgi:hypothetical protein
LNVPLLIVNLGIKIVEIFDQVGALEWVGWLLVIGVVLLDHNVELVPLGVKFLSVFTVLLDSINLLLVGTHFEGFVEGKRINLLKDCLKGDQRFLKDLVPMVLSEMNNYRHKHWESLILVGLQNVQKVVILEEAHSSICNLKMNTANALDDSLEQPWDKVFDLFDFTDLKDLLKLGQEKCFLDAVGKRPVLE